MTFFTIEPTHWVGICVLYVEIFTYFGILFT
jgi:hypothetical protein